MSFELEKEALKIKDEIIGWRAFDTAKLTEIISTFGRRCQDDAYERASGIVRTFEHSCWYPEGEFRFNLGREILALRSTAKEEEDR